MTIRTKSARGETVDFDLLKIKAQEAAVAASKLQATEKATAESAIPSVDIKPRETFVDKRNKRRLKKVLATATATDTVAAVEVAPAPIETTK